MSNLAKYTTDPVKAGRCDQILPEWGSIEDTCRIFSIGRTKLYSYISRGIVRSVCLREPGNATGKRIIFLPSVRAFLFSQLEAAETLGDSKGGTE